MDLNQENAVEFMGHGVPNSQTKNHHELLRAKLPVTVQFGKLMVL